MPGSENVFIEADSTKGINFESKATFIIWRELAKTSESNEFEGLTILQLELQRNTPKNKTAIRVEREE